MQVSKMCGNSLNTYWAPNLPLRACGRVGRLPGPAAIMYPKTEIES